MTNPEHTTPETQPPETVPPKRLFPTREEWSRTYVRTLLRVMHSAKLLERLTLVAAPSDLGPWHVRFVLRAQYTARLRDGVTAIAGALDNLRHLTGYHHVCETDAHDLMLTSRHLREAEQCLRRIENRHADEIRGQHR